MPVICASPGISGPQGLDRHPSSWRSRLIKTSGCRARHELFSAPWFRRESPYNRSGPLTKIPWGTDSPRAHLLCYTLQ